MKPASLHFAFLLLLLLSATTATAQLMRKDTASFPRSKWEIGLDLKPIWDQREPYNFVVRYFFKEKWALRGGIGLEMNWVDDTLSTMVFGTIDTISRLNYLFRDDRETRRTNFNVFVGIQYERSIERLRWYAAADLFYTREKDRYWIPFRTTLSIGNQNIPEQANSVIDRMSLREGGGIRLINGFRYHLLSRLSISAESSLIVQGVDFSDQMLIVNVNADNSLPNEQLDRHILGQGWTYDVAIKPFFRLFVNYHF
ncbi:MAG: hypothetical protein ACK4TA_03495 [Saprospiraceae bacterium]